MTETNLNRRDFLRGSSIALGAFFSSQTLMAIADTTLAPNPLPEFLNRDEFLMVSQLCDIIMPRTDTPGALDAAVPNTLDAIFAQVLQPDEQLKIRNGLLALNQLATKVNGTAFLGLSSEKQQAFAKNLNVNFVRPGQANANLVKKYGKSLGEETVQQAIDVFGAIKNLTLLAFFRSEPGATKVLQNLPIPGHYNGSVPLKEIGKTWAQS